MIKANVRLNKRNIFMILAVVVFLVLIFSGCAKQGVIPEAKENVSLSEIHGKNISLALSLSPLENNLSTLTLTVKSEGNVQNASGTIILPENVQLVEGSLEWQTDLEANESKNFTIKITPTGEKNWAIEATIKYEGETKPGLTQRIPEEYVHSVYLTEEEVREMLKKRVRSYAVGGVLGGYAPEPLKGEALNDYFKSLNLTDDFVYVFIQFDTLGFGDPSVEEMTILSENNVSLFQYHGDHTYPAKVPRSFLETKSYDFVRWIGVIPSANIHSGGFDKILPPKNCTGNIDLSVRFYERSLNEDQLNMLENLVNSFQREKAISNMAEGSPILINIDVGNIEQLISLNFVDQIEIYHVESICPPYKINCGVDPYRNVNCTG